MSNVLRVETETESIVLSVPPLSTIHKCKLAMSFPNLVR
jgi:hypothetical protein